MARPTKLTPDTQQKIETAIRMGATYELASKYAGIHYDTFNNWRKRGYEESVRRENPRVQEGTKQWEDEQPFFEFFEAIQKAEGDAAVGWLAKIEKSANDGNWQAAAWKLERRYPNDYNRNRTDVGNADGKPFEVQWSQVMRVDPDDTDDPFA